jgi:hypothetical protein
VPANIRFETEEKGSVPIGNLYDFAIKNVLSDQGRSFRNYRMKRQVLYEVAIEICGQTEFLKVTTKASAQATRDKAKLNSSPCMQGQSITLSSELPLFGLYPHNPSESLRDFVARLTKL